MKLVLAFAVLALLWPASAFAGVEAQNMALCRNAALAAADKHGVPRAVMLAISLVETRTRRGGVSGPWPWTVNVAGKGAWFDSRAAALLHAQRALAGGQKSFDVGCFQLNYRWHGHHFTSIDQMFEPGISGDYAARFVKSLHGETGDWIKASGLYHSRTAVHSKRYRKLVAQTVARMGGKVPEAVAVAANEEYRAQQRVFRVEGGTLVPTAERREVRTPSPGGVGLVILRRGQGGLLRLNNQAAGG
ncbi:MAG: lytic transglycosylase domain-containing protein [Pseudomonadota bacterium]